jgi:hypothetical protein
MPHPSDRATSFRLPLAITAFASGLVLLVAVLWLHWHDGTQLTGLGGPRSMGGSYSIGHGLWGVGVRVEWVGPLVAVAVLAAISARFLGRSRVTGLAIALLGAGSIALVIGVNRQGAGLVWALTAGALLVAVGMMASWLAPSRKGGSLSHD